MTYDEYKAWLASLKAGDEVVINRYLGPVRTGKVTSNTVSPKQRVTTMVDGIRFTDGASKQSIYRYTLEPATQAHRDEAEKRRLVSALLGLREEPLRALSLEALREAARLLGVLP